MKCVDANLGECEMFTPMVVSRDVAYNILLSVKLLQHTRKIAFVHIQHTCNVFCAAIGIMVDGLYDACLRQAESAAKVLAVQHTQYFCIIPVEGSDFISCF